MIRNEAGEHLGLIDTVKFILSVKEDGPAPIKHKSDHILEELNQQAKEGKLSIAGSMENKAHLKGGRLTSTDVYISPRPSIPWDQTEELSEFAHGLFTDSDSVDDKELQYEIMTVPVTVHPAGDQALKHNFKIYHREDVVVSKTKDGKPIEKPLRTRVWVFPN